MDSDSKFYVASQNGLWHFEVANIFERDTWADKLSDGP